MDGNVILGVPFGMSRVVTMTTLEVWLEMVICVVLERLSIVNFTIVTSGALVFK